jgi:aquaporin Z
MRAPSPPQTIFTPTSPGMALRMHWRLYLCEGLELAWFMVAACVATVVLFGASSHVVTVLQSAALRRAIMGVAMGLTAVMIIHSPMGKRSGAHFNPAITLTYLRLGKIAPWDAVFYIVGQFAGGLFGVGVSALSLGKSLAQPKVQYAVTVPGIGGMVGAFGAELFMATLLMGVVLWSTNEARWAKYTSYFVGVLIANYIFFFAPVSGFSINPARTVGSAAFARIWTGWWVYFVAPILGMFVAAEVYVRCYGANRVLCAKLHPAPSALCPFDCNVEGHLHRLDSEG